MRISDIESIVKNMKNGTYDFTVNGECSNCGNCCSNILPISSKEVKQIKRYIEKHGIKEQFRAFPVSTPLFDMTCPFRSETEKKCLIYEVRPQICRSFRCDYPSKNIQGNKNLYDRRLEAIMMRETFFGEGK